MIQVDQLKKRFGNVVAVNDVSFVASDGAITGLLGSNGAGKTTTLRMMGAVLRPDGGAVRIDGQAVAQNPIEAQKHVGALLDHTGLYGRLTARENLAYFGRLHGITTARLGRRIDEIITLLGLGKIADRRTGGFSQGERMKTALGRAIIHSPRTLLLDEPTNGIDVVTIRALRNFLNHLRQTGHCIIFSSHVLEEVRTLCDNIVILNGGGVRAQGTADELCRRSGTTSLEEAFVSLTAQEVAA